MGTRMDVAIDVYFPFIVAHLVGTAVDSESEQLYVIAQRRRYCNCGKLESHPSHGTPLRQALLTSPQSVGTLTHFSQVQSRTVQP